MQPGWCGMFLRLTIACCLASISAAQDIPQSATREIAAAANEFVATLDESQQGKLIYDFRDEAQRKRWHYFPPGMFPRGGLRVGDLAERPRAAAMRVLAAALSPQGYEKVLQIVESDEVIRKATRRNLGRDEYYISFLGQPSATEPWMIQFGGHHLAINITLAGAQGTLAPSHTGAQPAIYELEGKSVRPLGREIDKAFKLMSSLDPAQRKKAILGFQVRDLVLGQGQDGVTIQPEGIKGSELSEPQREMLLDLASEWVGIQDERVAQAKMDEIKGNISETWFAWSGSTEKGRAAYFRIQGPTVIIEYAPQGSGNPPMHIHTMYRDPTNDYGTSWKR